MRRGFGAGFRLSDDRHGSASKRGSLAPAWHGPGSFCLQEPIPEYS
jgi:hypothetical protein